MEKIIIVTFIGVLTIHLLLASNKDFFDHWNNFKK